MGLDNGPKNVSLLSPMKMLTFGLLCIPSYSETEKEQKLAKIQSCRNMIQS